MPKFYTGTNRLEAAIERQQGRIDALIEKGVDLQGRPIDESLANTHEVTAITASEHFSFQQCQSRAAAMGKINTDEALTIYNALGEWHNDDNGGWQDTVNLATKVIITQAMSELLNTVVA
jgi:hypothetical protein